MAKVDEYYEMGNRSDMTVERLMVIIEDMYSQLAVALNKKPEIYERNSDGSTSDVFLNNGDMNINSSSLKVEMLTEHSSTSAVVWTTLS